MMGDDVGAEGLWKVGGVWGSSVDGCCFFSVLELAVAASKTDPPDVLDRQKCLDALAEQRRSKWFQVCCFQASLFSLGYSVERCRFVSENFSGLFS